MSSRRKCHDTYPRPRPATYDAGAGIERKASLFLLDDMARSCARLQSNVVESLGGGKSESEVAISHVFLNSIHTQTTIFILEQVTNYTGARPRARSILSSRKSQTHRPSFSGALVEVSIKSSCAYTQDLAQPFMASEFCWRLPVAERLQVPAFFGPTTVQERGIYQGI